MTSRALSRRALLALGVAIPIAVAAFAARQELAPDGIGIDDSSIFLHYGRNIAAGNGWVWNPGEAPVEGTSSLLWTLVASLAVETDPLPFTLLFVVSLALVVAALTLWLDVLAAPLLESFSAITGAACSLSLGLSTGFFLAASPDFPIWIGATQMDSALWVAALLAVAATHARLARTASRADATAAACAQVLLALTRPESLVLGPLALAVTMLASRRRSWRPAAPLLAAIGAQAALAAWRLRTFGWPLPNTFYAKVGDDLPARLAEGFRYMVSVVERGPWWLVAWLLAAAVLIRATVRRLGAGAPEPHRASMGTIRVVASGLLLGAPALALFEGGDFFAGSRLLVPFLPLVAALFLVSLHERLRLRISRPLAIHGAALGIALIGLSAYLVDRPRWGRLEETTFHRRNFDAARGGFEDGERFERVFAGATAKPRVGILAAGAMPLAYSGPTLDLLGLNDAAIAHATRRRSGLIGHSAFTATPLFAAPPELLLVGTLECQGTAHERLLRRFAFRVLLADLDRDPRFPQVFELVQLCDPVDCVRPVCVYARRDWLSGGAAGRTWRPVPAPTSAPPELSLL